MILSPNVDQLFDDYHSFKQRINPIESTKLGETKYNDFVANYVSDDYQKDLKENYTSFLERIEMIDSSSLSESQWLSLQVMKWDASIKLEGLNSPLVSITSPMYNLPNMELTPLIQIQSLHLYFSQLAGGTSVQPFDTPGDYENWLSRVDDYLAFMDTCVEKMKEGMEKGVVLPKSLIVKILPQLQSFVTDTAEENLFYQPIALIADDWDEETKDRLTKSFETMIIEKLVPKYQEVYEFMREIYLPAGRETSGIGVLPGGKETYDYLIRLHTTTNMTADEIHELGLSEVARIRREMESVMDEVGFEET